MKKHIHKIVINGNKKYTHKYTYKFGNTNDISIELSKDSLCITAELTKIYDKNEMISQGCYLFPDAIKKALTLHLILFSKNVTIKTMTVQIDDESAVVADTRQGHTPPIFSMVDKELHNQIIEKWSAEEIEGFLGLTKSSDDSRLAALNAFIISKSKVFETERFIYLWTAFNGMYNYYAKVVSDIKGVKYKKEWKKIEFMLKLIDGGTTLISDKDKSVIGYKVVAKVDKNYNGDISNSSLNDKYKVLAQEIVELLINSDNNTPYDITPYGYLLMQFSYFFRCNIIHGDKPYALFSFADESEIKCLKCVNELLDEFIEINLHSWFDKATTNLLREKAQEI